MCIRYRYKHIKSGVCIGIQPVLSLESWTFIRITVLLSEVPNPGPQPGISPPMIQGRAVNVEEWIKK